MTPIHRGKVAQGKKIYDNPSRYLVQLSKLEGKRFEETLRQEKSKRSLNQNAAYWGIVINILSDHLGYDKDAMHDALKVKFASHVDPKTGLTVTESTTKMDTKRFMKYYEDIQRWASEFLNCYIPNPNEYDLL
jgi:hypothetical protein